MLESHMLLLPIPSPAQVTVYVFIYCVYSLSANLCRGERHFCQAVRHGCCRCHKFCNPSLGPPFQSVTCMSLDEKPCDKTGQTRDDSGQEPVCASRTGRAGRLIFRRVALTEHVGFRSGELRREQREQASEARNACKYHRACRDNGYSQP
ncbi:hypothetical protein IG631_12785 [Alternaria alternata]|nr:hypothetical protein IG631_12785 [Alternaria alternata]